jgi:hypothetical protein
MQADASQLRAAGSVVTVIRRAAMIDPAVALIMAVARCMTEKPFVSVGV